MINGVASGNNFSGTFPRYHLPTYLQYSIQENSEVSTILNRRFAVTVLLIFCSEIGSNVPSNKTSSKPDSTKSMASFSHLFDWSSVVLKLPSVFRNKWWEEACEKALLFLSWHQRATEGDKDKLQVFIWHELNLKKHIFHWLKRLFE